MPPDISAQIEKWRKHLLDTTRRNRLVNFKAGQTGGNRLVGPGPGDLWDCLRSAGRPVSFRWQRELIELPPEPEPDATLPQVLADDTTTAEAVPDQRLQEAILAQCLVSPRLR